MVYNLEQQVSLSIAKKLSHCLVFILAMSWLNSNAQTTLYSEDFESVTLCLPSCGATCALSGGWTNAAGDDMDWSVDENGTTSSGTGPTVDHTLGSSTGNYLYTEAASCLNKEGLLESPFIDISGYGNTSLEFWYHMFGSNMGDLYIDIYDGVSYTTVDSIKGQQQTSQGDAWLMKSISLTAFTDSVQIRFRGITGTSLTSDISIDDVLVTGDACVSSIPTGDVYGTWYKACSPYLINGHITVPDDSTLIIEPGVTVDFQGHYKFNVQGRILAIGTVADTIIFTAADTTNGWWGMRFDGTPASNDSSKFIFCKLQWGNANGSGNDAKGGAFFFKSFSKCRIANCSISNNTASSGGGICPMQYSSPVITGNTISNNTASSGGGIYCYDMSNPSISGNNISNNSASSQGGGIGCFTSSSPTITGNAITNNSAWQGGGIACVGSNSSQITNNTISNNLASGSSGGGGLHCRSNSNPVVKGTIFWGNGATSGNGANVYLEDNASDPPFDYCDVQGGAAGFYTNGNPYTGAYTNNIDADPTFTAPSGGAGPGFDGLSADWTLQVSSPCIDGGDPAYNPYSDLDLASNPRLSGCRIDIGALEYQQGFTLVTSISIDQEICFTNDGITSLGASGGTSYSYNWEDAQTTSTATGVGAGTFSVTTTEPNVGVNCFHVDSVTLIQPISMVHTFFTPTFNGLHIACFGDSTGSAQLNVSDGAPPYTYLWSTGSTSSSISNLDTGNYSYTITDNDNCVIASDSTFIQPAAPLSIDSVSKSDALCFGITGSATAHVSGATPSYTYNWSSGGSTQTVSLFAGSYSVTVTDNNGCSSVDNVVISEPAAVLSETNTITPASCFGYNDGAIDLTPAGGTSPYSYSWSNSETTEDLSSITTGSYGITLTDNNNCSLTNSIFVSQPVQINASVVNTPVSCFGGSNGSLNVAVTAGFSPFTFAWSNGPATEDISSLTAGSYSDTITDATGCFNVFPYTVVEPLLLNISSFSYIEPACYGFCDGSADVSVAGGNGGYSYLWDDFGTQTTSSPTGLCATTYSVTVTDSKGCTDTDSVAITQPTLLVANMSFTNVDCFGGGNGTASVVPNGGTSPYNYLWITGETTPGIQNLFPITYSVNVFDVKGCVANGSVTITQPSPMTSTLNSTAATCNGGSDGSASITASGGTLPYSYLWSNSGTTQNLSGLSTGTYSVTLTDFCGAIIMDSIVVDGPPVLSSSILFTDVSCFGYADGLATVIASGGTPPYTYLWLSNGNTSSSTSGLDTGVHVVTVTGSCGNNLSDTVLITEPLVLNTSMSSTDVSCYGGGNGTATVTPTGGTAPYNFLWSTGQAFATSVGLFPNNYTVNITDLNGCLASDIVTITQPNMLTGSASGTDASCLVGNDGTATISHSGGTGPYTYLWSPSGDTLAAASNLTQGTHTVTLTDSCGATIITSAFVGGPGSLSAVLSGTNVSCNGYTDGAVNLTVSSGTQPYSYLWSTGDTTEDIGGLVLGTYYVTVTDSCGSAIIDSLTISEPLLLNTVMSSSNVSCYGGGNGTATVATTGGTAPYNYLWSNGQANATTVGLFPGNYTVNVTDFNGCLASDIVTITQPNMLTGSASSTDASCLVGNDGTATISHSGGTGPYTYLWSPSGDTLAAAINLTQGTHTVTLTDSCGATIITSAFVGGPGSLSAVISGTNVSCNGYTDGAVNLTVSNGTQPYSYLWSTGDSTEDISGLVLGTYYVTVTDSCGAVIIDSLTINEPLLLNTVISSSDVSCYGGGNGIATITPTGGTAPYNYLWSNGQANATAVGLFPGNNTVNVTDLNGCLASDIVTITQPNMLTGSASSTDASCFVGNDGTATLTHSGGTGPYTYLWSPSGDTLATASNLIQGTYTVTLTDSCGATIITSAFVGGPGSLSAVLSGTNVSCNGYTDGAIDLTVSSGTQPYSYLWSTGDSTEDINGLVLGTYYVTVTDSCGSVITDSLTINEPALLTTSMSGTNISCNGAGDGSAVVTPSGGTAPYYYLWNNNQSIASLLGLFPGTYAVNVTDNNGCLASNSISISEPGAISIAMSVTDATCGSADGDASAVVSGGLSPYTYAWTSGGSSSTDTALVGGNYSLTVTDTNGCLDSVDVVIPITAPVQEICIVTVDSTSTMNVIVWEKPVATNIDSFRIYRDIIGVYTLVGSQPYGVESYFADSASGINPQVTSYRYKVTTFDACGNESALGSYHETIHVQTTDNGSSVDLLWDNYEGFNFGFYRILRDSTGLGGANWEKLDSVTNSNFTYTDINPPTIGAQYVIEVVPSSTCLAEKSKNFNSSKSNTSSFGGQGSITATSTATDASFGGCDGTATVTPSGGVQPYTYLWDGSAGFQATATAAGLCAGNYSVTVTDANGETLVTSQVVGEASGSTITATTASNDASSGICDGDATVTASGGTPPYTYAWDGNASNQTTQTATGLCPGTYSVNVFDSLGNYTTVFTSVGTLIGVLEFNAEEEALSIYPNPYTDKTNITYKLAREASVVLEVFNVLGEHISTLAKGQQAAGSHECTFSAGQLGRSAGVYIVMIRVGGIVYGKRIVELQ